MARRTVSSALSLRARSGVRTFTRNRAAILRIGRINHPRVPHRDDLVESIIGELLTHEFTQLRRRTSFRRRWILQTSASVVSSSAASSTYRSFESPIWITSPGFSRREAMRSLPRRICAAIVQQLWPLLIDFDAAATRPQRDHPICVSLAWPRPIFNDCPLWNREALSIFVPSINGKFLTDGRIP